MIVLHGLSILLPTLEDVQAQEFARPLTVFQDTRNKTKTASLVFRFRFGFILWVKQTVVVAGVVVVDKAFVYRLLAA